jgi:hypothetical protein
MSCSLQRRPDMDHNAASYRAESARLLDQADNATDPKVRSALLEIAHYYDRMAAWVQVRRFGKTPDQV